MESQQNILTFPPDGLEPPHLVVIGNGVAGVACIEEILKYSPKFRVTVFGDRMRATLRTFWPASIREKSTEEAMLRPLEWYQEKGIGLRLGIRIVDVDPIVRTVVGEDGSVTEFDTLLLATGGSAAPRMGGTDKNDVELGRRSGLKVNHGIVVNEYMETSHPGIYAVGEWAEHQGFCYREAMSFVEQAKVVAAAITGNRGPVYRGSAEKARLTIMDADVLSAR